MNAIVLTYDRNTVLTEHMIKCYEELWPDHPFTFRIPFQDDKRCVPAPRREYIRSSPAIKATVLTLLQDLDDDEWIYWCIDDKYPIKLIVDAYNNIQKNIGEMQSDIYAISLCRAKKLLDENFVSPHPLSLFNYKFLVRKTYHQIWLHQFIRVESLRYLFSGFPEKIEKAADMVNYIHATIKPDTQKLLVTDENLAVYGESSSAGILTENCFKSLKTKGFNMPNWFDGTLAKEHIIGTL